VRKATSQHDFRLQSYANAETDKGFSRFFLPIFQMRDSAQRRAAFCMRFGNDIAVGTGSPGMAPVAIPMLFPKKFDYCRHLHFSLQHVEL
jgi:hypothetical protein